MQGGLRKAVFGCVVAACGSSTGAPAAQHEAAGGAGGNAAEARARHERDERAKHDEVSAAHRKLEEEQQDALAATCSEPEPHDKRCVPSCYTPALGDPRAGKKVRGSVELQHLVCQRVSDGQPSGAYVIVDELDPKLALRPARRFPRPHKKGTWQAEVEAALGEQVPKPRRGDVIVVSGWWRDLSQPLTEERLHCVTVSHYTKLQRPLDACGGEGDLACEAMGDAAAHGLDVVHFRLAEARRLQAAGKAGDCEQAALEAVAVARGLPRWRQYAKLNADHWTSAAAFRTRFDGVLDDDALIAQAASLGTEAEAVYVACGGAAGAPTKVDQEQSFHRCW